MTQFYVDAAAADDTGTGLTPGSPKKIIKSMVDLARADAAGPHTLNIADGNYTHANDYIVIDHANFADCVIKGEGRTLTNINGSATHPFNANVADITIYIQDLTLRPAVTTHDAIRKAGSCNIIGTNIDLIAPLGGYDYYLLYGVDTGQITLNNPRFFHNYGVNFRSAAYLGGAVNFTVNNCISAAMLDARASSPWTIATTGTVNINNSAILDSQGAGLSFTAAGTFNVNNCIVNSGMRNSGAYPIYRSAGTLTISDTHVIANPFNGDGLWISGTAGVDWIDGGGNVFTNANPAFNTYPRKGFILIGIDDRGNLQYAESLGALLDAYGYKATFFVQTSDSAMSRTFTADEKTRLRALVSDNVIEVGCHSDTHSQLSLADDTVIWNITGKTLTIERAGGGTITVSGGAGTVANFKAKTLDAIRTELVALGCTVTPTTNYTDIFSTAAKLWKGAYGEVIKEAAALSTEVKLLVDATGATGYFKAEMADPKAYLADTVINGDGAVTDGQTLAPYVCNSFGTPFNGSSIDVRAAGMALLYTNLRGVFAGEDAADFAAYCTDLNIFKLYSFDVSTYLKGDGTEANIRKNAKAIAFAVAHGGMIVDLMYHSPANLTDPQWGYVLEEFAKYGDQITVTSHQLFAAAIAAGWTDDGDGTFSRIYTVGDGDYHLTVATPQEIRNGGKDVGLTADFEGSVIPFGGGFPIGPYRGPAMGSGLSPGLGLSCGGGHMPPWRRRRR